MIALLRRLLLALVLAAAAPVLAAKSAAADEIDKDALPSGVELPIRVRVALRVLDIAEVKEVAGQAKLLVEATQRWSDPRNRFDPVAVGTARVDRVGKEAEAFLDRIWTPGLVADNQIGDAESRTVAVSAHADGEIVVVERWEADFRVALDMAAFPFDHQEMKVSFSLPRWPKQDVVLTATEADRRFSTVEKQVAVVDWRPTGLTFANAETTGWNARSYSRLDVGVGIERLSVRYILRIFVPIVAVLAVSVYVLWAPGLGATDKGNMIFSALLALAAVSFTFEASFPGSISLNTPVAQIISLGYLYLILVLACDALLASHCADRTSRFHRAALELRRQASWALPTIMTVVCAGAVVRVLPV